MLYARCGLNARVAEREREGIRERQASVASPLAIDGSSANLQREKMGKASAQWGREINENPGPEPVLEVEKPWH